MVLFHFEQGKQSDITPRLFYRVGIIFSFPLASCPPRRYIDLTPSAFETLRSGGKSGLATSAETWNESDSIEQRENVTGKGMGKRNREE